MPQLDRTGPEGKGPMTGRGLGLGRPKARKASTKKKVSRRSAPRNNRRPLV